MAISYNTGATASANTASSCAITIPSGVALGDLMLIGVACFTEVTSAPTISFSGGAGAWTLLSPMHDGSNPEQANNGTLYSYGYVYYRVASAGDPGATLTVSETGSSAGLTWFALALASYTGASGGQPDVAGSNAANQVLTIAAPTETTATGGDWAVGMLLGGTNTAPPSLPSTSRQAVTSSAGITAGIWDSNGSVGAAGTSIGGATVTGGNTTGGNNFATFTIGLAPGSAGAASPPFTPARPGRTWLRRYHHPQRSALSPAPLAAGNVAAPAPASLAMAPAPATAVTASAGVATAAGSAGNLSGAGTLTMKFASADGNNVESWTSNSPLNSGGNHVVRILRPTSADPSKPHVFLYCLPVAEEGNNAYGSALDILQANGYHNKYNATLIEPTYGIKPWYGDSDSDATEQLESVTVAIANWVRVNLGAAAVAIQGYEAHHLLGFSKSGTGGGGLIFRHPGLFGKGAFWDTPWDMSTASRFSPDAPANYGSDANFAANYYLSSTFVAARDATFLAFPRARLWIGGGVLYPTECSDFVALLATATVPAIDGTSNTGNGSHVFDATWVLPGADAILGATGIPASAGTANQPAAAITANAGVAAAAAVANAPSVSTVGGTNAPAAAGAASAVAVQPVATITVTAGVASSAGAALAPSHQDTASPAAAPSAGQANAPSTAITVGAAVAISSGVALQPVVNTSGSTSANAAVAMVQGVANTPAITITVTAGVARAAGIAPSATGSTTAFDNAPAVVAMVQGAALAPRTAITAVAAVAAAAAAAVPVPPKFTIGVLSGATTTAAATMTATTTAAATMNATTQP